MANVRQRLRTGARRLRRRFVSINSLPEFHDITSTPQSPAVGRNRAFSMDNLESDSRRRIAWQEEDVTWDRSHVLTTKWLEEWQVPLVVPFGQQEFKHRVEAVRSAILAEMDHDLARDMRSYNLAGRRHATCKEMLSPELEKAACMLGILGF